MGTGLLRYAVTVDGQVYLPGDHIPPEVERRITNPKVWEPTPEPSPDAPVRRKPGPKPKG